MAIVARHFCGLVRQVFRVAASPDRSLAGEKLYPGAAAAFSPAGWRSDGPTPFSLHQGNGKPGTSGTSAGRGSSPVMKFTEWTRMRHPVCLGLRSDKRAEDVVRESENKSAAPAAYSQLLGGTHREHLETTGAPRR
jgi:hypothetical protein